jgi:hypothetical protein
VANILWTGIGYKESQRGRGIELTKSGGEFREKGGKSLMELIYQGSAILHHISPEAGELPKVIEHGVRQRKRFMVPQGEKSCQRTGIDTVSLGFLSLGFTELVCPVGVNLHHLVAMGEKEVSQGNSIIPGSFDANEEVLFVWRKLLQSAEEFLKSLAIDIEGEHPGIRILGKVVDTSLVLTFTDIYSYMKLSQDLTSFHFCFVALGESRLATIHALNQGSPDVGVTVLLIRGHQAGASFNLQGYFLSPV